MATTTNYAWSTPDDTALVSAGASAMRTLGSAIDSTLGGQKNIKQIVTATTSLAATSSSNTFSDTGLTATITPTKSTNQVLVIAVHGTIQKTAGATGTNLGTQLMRGATVIQSLSDYLFTNSLLIQQQQGPVHVYLDSPATTAATVYKTQFRSVGGAASVSIQYNANPSFIFLLEIGV